MAGNKGLTYKDAGVDIDAGNHFVERIKPHVATTKRLGSDTKIGGFGGIFDIGALGMRDPLLVSATDGVGTKLEIAIACDRHDTIGIDLVAMCVNDLVVQGAEPLYFLDYFATGHLDVARAEQVVKGIADGCVTAGCALIGGETAEMPGLYQNGHYDLAGFAVGAVERDQLLPRTDTIQAGDLIIGLLSSGFHSNGYSLVRKVVEKAGLSYHDRCPVYPEMTLGSTLLRPTRIYVKSCLAAARTGKVKALAHITGGGFVDNIPRVLADHQSFKIDYSNWDFPPVFEWVQRAGNISHEEMIRTFNCGIGMVLVVSRKDFAEVHEALTDNGERDVVMLGEVVE